MTFFATRGLSEPTCEMSQVIDIPRNQGGIEIAIPWIMTDTTNETLIRISHRAGAVCHRCGGRMERGTYCYAASGLRWHTECPATVSDSAPVTAPVSVDTARPAPYYRQFGALAVDGDSFRRWELEYAQEN